MTLICGECGGVIPADMDFCPRCGSLRSNARVVNDGRTVGECPSCGGPLGPDDLYCGRCGSRISTGTASQGVMRPRRNANLAIMLALIPGFFNVFGLGHFVLRQYSRGIMFLVISVVLWYLGGWKPFPSSLLLTVLTICVFFYQAMDILRLSYTREGRCRTGPRSTALRRLTASSATRPR